MFWSWKKQEITSNFKKTYQDKFNFWYFIWKIFVLRSKNVFLQQNSTLRPAEAEENFKRSISDDTLTAGKTCSQAKINSDSFIPQRPPRHKVRKCCERGRQQSKVIKALRSILFFCFSPPGIGIDLKMKSFFVLIRSLFVLLDRLWSSGTIGSFTKSCVPPPQRSFCANYTHEN